MAKAILSYEPVMKVENGFNLPVNILYYGTDVMGGQGDLSQVTVTILGTDTLAQIKTKIVNAVVADAPIQGHTLAAADITMPAFMSGV